ncbi:MAG: VOC family protein [Steroidobacteraceae bacterium]
MLHAALRPVQVAYHVPDPVAAAEQFARDFGWGPFYLMEHIPLARSAHRGRPAPFDHSSAYGQGGEVMIELITQHGDGPSALRDMYAAHETGIHHVACFVPDLQAALAEFRAAGAEIALDARTQTGVDFALVDTVARLGHMLELYEPGPDLLRFYAFVRGKSVGWDGSRPLRALRG